MDLDSVNALDPESQFGVERLSSESATDSEFEEESEEASKLSWKLGNAVIEAENAKKKACGESLRRLRIEEDAMIVKREVEAAENRLKEELNRRKELEELLLKQNKENEANKTHYAQYLRELVSTKEYNLELETQLTEAQSSEKELVEKIVQAVQLFVSFREKRDKLRAEYDSATREVNRYKALDGVDPQRTPFESLFGISFSEIIEATHNFNASHKIGEGKYGSVYRGILRNVKVAITMLPSSGSQSDSEFMNEVQILSRVRHPNLVTLVGACPESKSLIYEYIAGSSLETYLSTPAKTSSLSWQTRIRIATEICSALVFIHANSGSNVHGNLKPSNVLLDANLVVKVSDFGVHSLASLNGGARQSPYLDPESHDTGQLTPDSDVYSFGVVLLQLLTGRPASGVVRDAKLALKRGNIKVLISSSSGNWPVGITQQVADLGLRCCEDRPHLESGIWPELVRISESHNLSHSESCSINKSSQEQQKLVPSHFYCPIYQEVMQDPHIAGDGFTYEGDAIKGWFNSGHDTSPMTNLKLQDCGLTPNYALYYAIQEWLHNT